MITNGSTTPKSKNCNMARPRATKQCNMFILHKRQPSPTAGSQLDENAPTNEIIRYDTLEMNKEGMLVIPRDVFCPKPKSWSEDYIVACLPYRPAFDRRCWDAEQRLILEHCFTQNTTANRNSWGDCFTK